MSGVLGKAALKLGQAGATMAAGVLADRLTQEQTNTPPPSTRPLRSGNEALGQLTARAKVPSDAPDPLRQGAMNQVQNRINLASKLGTLAADPRRAADNASHAAEQLSNEMKVLHGVAVIAKDGQLTPSDGARLAKAAVESGGNSLMNLAKAGFAAATTSPSSVKALGEAVTDRAAHEAKVIGTGLAVSQAAAAAVAMVPHPAAKIAAVAIRTTGQMAAGANASEVLRQSTAEVTGPIGKEIAAIAREKSAQSTSKPSDGGSTQ